jgi:hypothetical protein
MDGSTASLYIYETYYIRETPRFDLPILAFCITVFCSVVPLSAVQWIKGEQYL